jgi:hypothetical protein
MSVKDAGKVVLGLRGRCVRRGVLAVRVLGELRRGMLRLL